MLRFGCGAVWALAGFAALAQQPIEYPHNKHVAAGMECIDCHIRVDTRAEAGLPSVRKCMLCHRTIATEKAEVKKLAQFAQQQREIPWERVYGFERGAHVKFQHAPHVRASVACKTCHGEVEKMTVAQPAVRHTMGTCVTCHRQQNATTDCVACHY